MRLMNRHGILPHRNENMAFTLVELLVVIAIISVLVALMLPALRSARVAAQASQSLAQVRQLNIVMMAYANDNRDSLPYSQWVDGNMGTAKSYWGYRLFYHGYVPDIRIYWSPGHSNSNRPPGGHEMPDVEDLRNNPHTGALGTKWARTGYAVNFRALTTQPAFLTGQPPPFNLAHKTRHSETITFVDNAKNYFRVNPGNTGVQLFSYLGGVVHGYLDGHATMAVPEKMYWTVTSPISGDWGYTSESHPYYQDAIWFNQY